MKRWLFLLFGLLFLAVLCMFLLNFIRKKEVYVSNKMSGCGLYKQSTSKLVDLETKVKLKELGIIDFSLKKEFLEDIKETCRQEGCWDAFIVKDFEVVEIILTNEVQPYHKIYQEGGKVVTSDGYSVDNFKGKKRLKIWVQVDLDLIKKYFKRSEYSNKINERVAEALYGISGNRFSSVESGKYWTEENNFIDSFKGNYNFFDILCL